MTIALMLAAAAYASGGFTDLDALDRAVAGFTGVSAGQVGGAITPVNRRLRLQPCSMAPVMTWLNPRRDVVLVQCPDAGSWRLAVPVSRGAAPDGGEIVVNRGDAVSISVEGEGFSVSRPGQALDQGPVGAWVRVQPATTGREQVQPVRGQIVRPGLVRVPLD
jgi:flagella basal body P-ring formation protein FlgA